MWIHVTYQDWLVYAGLVITVLSMMVMARPIAAEEPELGE